MTPAHACSDALGVGTIYLPESRPSCRDCVATVVTPGFERHLEMMLHSLKTQGALPDTTLVVVFAVNADAACLDVIGKYQAFPLFCHLDRPPRPWIKALLYSAADVIDAERFLCLDADTYIAQPVKQIFDIAGLYEGEGLFVCRELAEGQGSCLRDSARTIYNLTPETLDAWEITEAQRQFPLLINDGVFAAGAPALRRVAARMRALPSAARTWATEHDIGNQFLFNLCVAEEPHAVELSPVWNLMLGVARDVRIWRSDTTYAGTWEGAPVKIFHCSGVLGRPYAAHFQAPRTRPEILHSFPDTLSRHAEFMAALRLYQATEGEAVFSSDGNGHAPCAANAALAHLELLREHAAQRQAKRILDIGTGTGLYAACLAAVGEGVEVTTLDTAAHPARPRLWQHLTRRLAESLQPRIGDILPCLRQMRREGVRFDMAHIAPTLDMEWLWQVGHLARHLVGKEGDILLSSPGGSEPEAGAPGRERWEQTGCRIIRLPRTVGGETGFPEEALSPSIDPLASLPAITVVGWFNAAQPHTPSLFMRALKAQRYPAHRIRLVLALPEEPAALWERLRASAHSDFAAVERWTVPDSLLAPDKRLAWCAAHYLALPPDDGMLLWGSALEWDADFLWRMTTAGWPYVQALHTLPDTPLLYLRDEDASAPRLVPAQEVAGWEATRLPYGTPYALRQVWEEMCHRGVYHLSHVCMIVKDVACWHWDNAQQALRAEIQENSVKFLKKELRPRSR